MAYHGVSGASVFFARVSCRTPAELTVFAAGYEVTDRWSSLHADEVLLVRGAAVAAPPSPPSAAAAASAWSIFLSGLFTGLGVVEGG